MEKRLKEAQALVSEGASLWIREGKLSWAPEIIEAASYVMEGGKAARPALLLWSMGASAVVENSEAISSHTLHACCREAVLALEMIHVYSLVHDDLPAMDNDDLRRGRPTLHKKFNEARAILTGDALLTGAFEILSHAPVSDHMKVLLVRELAMAAGAAGMIAGQVWDLEAEATKCDDLDLWTRIHDAKTGALFGAALSMGFILGSEAVAEADLADARNWGIRLGRLFQIVDDKLDRGPFFRKLGPDALEALCVKEAQSLMVAAAKIWGSPQALDEILDFFVRRTQ